MSAPEALYRAAEIPESGRPAMFIAKLRCVYGDVSNPVCRKDSPPNPELYVTDIELVPDLTGDDTPGLTLVPQLQLAHCKLSSYT
jgi:hypothetical protein